MKSELVCEGIRFGEGPVWCADSGTVVVTSVPDGALYRIWPQEALVEQIAVTQGGANGAALASDGSILVTQNGGIDFSAVGLYADPPEYRPTTPGLQLARPDGSVVYLASDGFHAPNDVAVAADNRVLFTDPGHHPATEDLIGRVMALETDGTVSVVAEDFFYCNGIAFERDGTLVVIERSGLQRVFPDGSREWIVEVLGPGAGDGFCLDADGRFYVAATMDHGIRVIEPDGTEVDFLEVEGTGLVTNCCFGGPDLRSLYVTDSLPGTVVVFEGMPTRGLPLREWDPIPAAKEA